MKHSYRYKRLRIRIYILYLSSILTNVIICSMLRYNTKPNNKLFVYGSWHHMKFSGCIYCTQKLLVEFVTSSQSKTYQRQLNNRDVLIQRDPIDRGKYYYYFTRVKIFILHTLTSLQTTNRSSCKQYFSNTFANRQCSRMYACNPVIP